MLAFLQHPSHTAVSTNHAGRGEAWGCLMPDTNGILPPTYPVSPVPSEIRPCVGMDTSLKWALVFPGTLAIYCLCLASQNSQVRKGYSEMSDFKMKLMRMARDGDVLENQRHASLSLINSAVNLSCPHSGSYQSHFYPVIIVYFL